jgi:hypothetical protein
MDSCRVVGPFDAVVASMARLKSGFTSVEHLGEGYAESERGGGDLWSLRTRRFF